MSADEWDADDFEPSVPVVAVTDKWDGEDESEDVKDAWDAEDEKKSEAEAQDDGTVKAVQRKKKKPLAERIAEKEAARLQAEQDELAGNQEMTKEEKRAEADRIRKEQEEADLKLAKEAFGVTESGLDSMYPETEDDFVAFKDALKTKISSFKKSSHYGAFLDKLVQDLLVDLNVEDTKKISSTASSLFHEKQRQHKEQTSKKKKGKGKGVVVAERDTDFNDLAIASQGGYDDGYYDDDFI